MKRAKLTVSAFGGEVILLDVKWEGDPRGTPQGRQGFANRVAHDLGDIVRSELVHQKVEAACDRLWERRVERVRQRPWRVAAILLCLAWGVTTFGWLLS